ncbi:MAG: hypothetical protein ACFFD5_06545 [Candidatus Thorarchaeota archaeon]
MSMLELQEKVKTISDEQLKELYSLASKVSLDAIEELCPALLNICLNAEGGVLKNELGRVIFHLQKTERINTRIGLEKLLHGALIVNAEEVFKLLEEAEEKGLANNIKELLQ